MKKVILTYFDGKGTYSWLELNKMGITEEYGRDHISIIKREFPEKEYEYEYRF